MDFRKYVFIIKEKDIEQITGIRTLQENYIQNIHLLNIDYLISDAIQKLYLAARHKVDDFREELYKQLLGSEQYKNNGYNYVLTIELAVDGSIQAPARVRDPEEFIKDLLKKIDDAERRCSSLEIIIDNSGEETSINVRCLRESTKTTYYT